MSLKIEAPIISSALYPKIRSAAAFQLVTTPSRVLPTMASTEEDTIAARRALACSVAIWVVTSRVKQRV
jgi:hypothetical protein